MSAPLPGAGFELGEMMAGGSAVNQRGYVGMGLAYSAEAAASAAKAGQAHPGRAEGAPAERAPDPSPQAASFPFPSEFSVVQTDG